METPSASEKVGKEEDVVQYASSSNIGVEPQAKNDRGYLKHYFTSSEGWIETTYLYLSFSNVPFACKIQDYHYLITPNIWPLNRKYKDYIAPFYGLNDEIPIFLTLLLGLQHALAMIGSIVSPFLAIAGGAFNIDPKTTQYLVSAAFYHNGHCNRPANDTSPRLLSVVGPTFDILPIAFSYTSMRYANGTCLTSEDGTQLPCPGAWGEACYAQSGFR
ncbi:putative purine permease [Lachnellula occidentalis]|uniref:Putative purine permease n=1 Tax=Lachnellula occidentalis TaxID=215460 RepID=A0A8H8RJI4_9HELO|nr:putative purine permease [Lachnellula occidentalis]